MHNENTWPPNQPKAYTPLVLIHYQDQTISKHSLIESDTELIQTGGSDITLSEDVLNNYRFKVHEALRPNSATTKNLMHIISPLEKSDKPQFVLVEGLPGIGKSMLLQEIALRWSKRELLKTFKLLLLVPLRNPAVHHVSFISDLLQLFCKGDARGLEISGACSEYFFSNGGKDLVFLFDGFDEFPERFQKEGLIFSILKREVLPNCGLLVSSRPHSSVELREKASVKVDILGFAEKERQEYIEEALNGKPHKIKELANYIDNHLTINGLCYVPFFMVVLVFIYKKDISLPESSVELYQYFICLTICRYLAKSGHNLDNTITDLSKLPEPCKTIINQLSKLSLKGIDDNKLVFSFDELKADCPGITKYIDGFGLLQAVQHFGLAGKTITFNFIHYSIQEFLAAYHIANLPPHEELRILQEKFWSRYHANMFSMYTSLTKGQRPSFKQYLQQYSMFKRIFTGWREDKINIAAKFLQNTLKCFHLFHCFHEAGDLEMCQSILNSRIFTSNSLHFWNHHLTHHDVQCLTLFLACSSPKMWDEVDLVNCNIQDHGLRVLYRGIIASNVSIKKLWLGYNNLTQLSSSCVKDLTIHCKVKGLWISGNPSIGEDHSFFDILSHPFSELTSLTILNTELSSCAVISLFTELAKGNILEQLRINFSDITSDTYDVICAAMKENTSLVRLFMNTYRVSVEDAQQTVKALHLNNTLQELFLYPYSDNIKENLIFLQDELNKKRESRGSKVKLHVEFSDIVTTQVI